MQALLFSLSSCHFQATIAAAPIAHQTDDEEDQTVATEAAPADAIVEGKPPINTQNALTSPLPQ